MLRSILCDLKQKIYGYIFQITVHQDPVMIKIVVDWGQDRSVITKLWTIHHVCRMKQTENKIFKKLLSISS